MTTFFGALSEDWIRSTSMSPCTSKNDENEEDWRFIGILDLPSHSAIALDGYPIVLQRDDFVGFSNVPLYNPRDGFHLVTVKAGRVRTDARNVSGGTSTSFAVAVGFILPTEGPFLRRFDPLTEEVSFEHVEEDPSTLDNLRSRIQLGQVDPQRILDYATVISESQRQTWRDQTSFISPQLLARRGLANGDKIVPGAYGEDDPSDNDLQTKVNQTKEQQSIDDGKAISYPPVPVLPATPSNKLGTHRVHHAGTKRFLARLDPSQRTKLMLDPHPGAQALNAVLQECYDSSWRDLLGDIQLSWLLFQHLHCFASFEHWRDVVAMLAWVDDPSVLQDRMELYTAFLHLLSVQVLGMEADLFDDAELSGDNVLIPSWQRLLQTASQISSPSASSPWNTARSGLEQALQQRFPNHFSGHFSSSAAMELDATQADDGECNDNDEEDDGPLVVSSDEVEASWCRIRSSEVALMKRRGPGVEEQYPEALRRQYPVLFAAKLPTEDVVMTCARALADVVDVSLVREASDYLEHVEAHQVV